MRTSLEIQKSILMLPVLIILTLPVLTACSKILPNEKMPVATDGVIDLRQWDFVKDGPVKLNGEWEFCWNEHREPADFMRSTDQSRCRFISVPSLWNENRINGIAVPGKGYATYRLKMITGEDKTEKSLCIHRIFSAYRLWINGKLTDERGEVDKSSQPKEDYIFIHNKRYTAFIPDKTSTEIILEVFNSDYESGGIDRPILLEDRRKVEQKKSRQYTLNIMVFGMLLFASIYNIVLYFFRRQEKAALYFGFACLDIAINTINHDFPLLSGSFSYPGNPYFLNYFTAIITIPLCLMTIKSLFPDECSKFSVRLSQAISSLLIITLFLVGFKTAELMMRFFFISMIFFIMYIFFVLIKAILKRRNDAILFFIGFSPMLIGGINDVFYALWIINTTNIAQYGLIVLCIATSVVISRRFARALRTVEKLSEDLAEKNIALEKMDRLKDQFLANTSHELRTPLNGMIGLSESMLEGSAGVLPPKAQENLSLISSSGHRLASMVNDLLDMAKVQDEGLNLNLRPVDLYTLSEMVVKLSLPLAAGKPLEIRNSIQAGTPMVCADEDRIRQVMHNLIGNAIKFTTWGTIKISARTIDPAEECTVPGKGRMVEVSVSDTGIGVPEEYIEKIFEAYIQVDGGDSRKYTGTGLGLAIAKQIIELHGGTICVSSGKDGGSIFSFTLPQAADQAHENNEAIIIQGTNKIQERYGAPQSTCDSRFEGNPVILVVDDDPINIKIIQDYFNPKQCQVKTASDGTRGLEIIETADQIDLVLLDIMMPGMSGYEVCRRIRLKRPPDDLPVIMLTAKNTMTDIDAAFEAGANDYIVKPFSLSELQARVSTMLKLRNIRRSAAETITLSDRNTLYSIKFSEIAYITSHLKSCVIHTTKRDIELPVLLKEITDRLPPDIFLRIHKSHVININFVENVSHVLSGRYKVRLRHEDETELPVGSAFLEILRKKIQN